MKARIASWLIRLYPAGARRRYGAEIEAVIYDIDARLRWSDLADLLKGALTMPQPVGNWMRAAAILFGTSILCAMAGGYWMARVQAQFVSKALVRFDTGSKVSAINDRLVRALSAAATIELVDKEQIYPGTAGEKAVDLFMRNVRVSPIVTHSGGPAVQMLFVHDDAATAQRALQKVVALALAEPDSGVSAYIDEAPSFPRSRTHRNPDRFFAGAISGCFAGLVLGFAGIRMMRV